LKIHIEGDKMKKLIYSLLMILSMALPLAAQSAPAAVTQTATAVSTPGALQAEPDKNVFEGTVTKIQFNLKTDFQKDDSGQVYRSELGIKAAQTLANEWRAGAYIRFIKPLSNGDDVTEIKLMQAKFEYVGKFFRVLAGRTDLTQSLSTLSYFGPYITAGQRYLDTISISLPIYLKAGVPQIEEIELPPMAISLYYMPAMFSQFYSTYDGQQEYFMFQLRVNANIFDSPLIFIGNLGKSTYSLFYYSVMSGNLAFDLNLSLDLFEHVKVNAAFAALNTAAMDKTSVAAAGVEIHDLAKTILVIDSVIFEMQFPLSAGVPESFDPESMQWFLVAKNNIGRFRYFFSAGTGTNDYTLKSAKSINPAHILPFGQGNIYTPENIIMDSLANGRVSFNAGIGYEF
jgi:hypothetical protein